MAVLVKVEVRDGGSVAVLVAVEVGDGGSVAVLVAVEVGDGGSVAVYVAVLVGDGGMVDVLVEVGDGGIVAVKVEVGRVVGVLLGIQPPCIRISEIEFVSAVGVIPIEIPACSSDAFTALKDRQVNGINKPIKSASNASNTSVVRFLFLSDTPTSMTQ